MSCVIFISNENPSPCILNEHYDNSGIVYLEKLPSASTHHLSLKQFATYIQQRGFNILCRIMVTFFSYISNACHSLSGVAERLQHTYSKHRPNIINNVRQYICGLDRFTTLLRVLDVIYRRVQYGLSVVYCVRVGVYFRRTSSNACRRFLGPSSLVLVSSLYQFR